MEEVIGSIPLGSTILPFDDDLARASMDGLRAPEGGRSARVAIGVALVPTRPAPASSPPAASSPARDDRSATSGDAKRLIASLRARILAAHSATLALEAWCAERYFAADPRLVALRLPVPDKPLSAVQRLRLAIGPDEPVCYRRVRLACGTRVLSEADNWYVPGRLTLAMNAALDTTRTPFGRVVQSLDPVRRTLDQRVLSSRARPDADEPLFAVDALLTTGSGDPFCEVAETYLGGALPAVVR